MNGKLTLSADEADKAVFTCEANSNSSQNGFWLKSGSRYLYTNNNAGLAVNTDQTNSDNLTKSWHYKADGKNLLWYFKDTSTSDGYTDTSSTYKYYLECNNGVFTDNHASTTSLANTNTPKMYLFALDETPAHEHTYGEPTWTWADDYSSATATFTCTAGDDTKTITDSKPVKTVVTAATCEDNEVAKYTAKVTFNEKEYTDTTADVEIADSATGHSLTAHPAAEATCEAAGNSAYWSCDNCGKYFSDAEGTAEIEEGSWIIPAIAHTPGETVIENEVAATCEKAGSYDEVVYCTVCNAEISRETITVPAGKHSYGEPEYVWSEGNSKVTAHAVCTVCEHEAFEIVDTTSETIAPKCEEAGKTVYTTKPFKSDAFTEQTKEVEIPATGHTWGEWTVKTPATELIEGVEERACSICGKTETRAIPVLGHTHVLTKVEAVAAGCESAGNEEYWVCSSGENPCGRYFSDAAGTKEIEENSWVIPATGHDWDEGVVTKEPTCTAAGEKTFTCRNCGETRTEAIAPGGHEYGEPTYEWATGNTSVTAMVVCTKCGEDITEKVPAKLDSEKSKAPTCEAAGKNVYVSDEFRKYDGFEVQTKEETLGALGHDWGEWKVTKEPTADNEGVETRTCKRCGKAETRAIPKKGSDPNQMGEDGTAVGPGASEVAADEAITNMPSDDDLPGSVFNKLRLRSPKQTTKSITLSWTKVSGAKKYVIYANRCGKSNKPKKLATIKGNSTFTKKVKKVNKKAVKKGKYYKFIIVALDKDNNVLSTSKVIHVATKGGKVGNHKSVTVSKKVLNSAKALKKGSSLKIGAKAVAESKKLPVKKHVALRYESSNKKIATVSKKGTIKAKKKGTCYVYVFAQDGVYKKIKVVVK